MLTIGTLMPVLPRVRWIAALPFAVLPTGCWPGIQRRGTPITPAEARANEV